MNNIFQDEAKIKIFAQIQENLLGLQPNSSEEEIDNLISQIPQNILQSKDDLMTVCQLFSHYGNYISHLIRGNVIKLFEKILEPIKTHLQDESYFLWNIFDGLNYFKLIMYEQGLISIQQIIMSSQLDKTFITSEYFLPEIIEYNPDIFEKELKYKIHCPYSKDYIEKLKEKRKKHINWIRNSNNYKDPEFKEIENDSLRLAIKTDDIDGFQKILSHSNLSINSKIFESIFDNYLIEPRKIPLIELAINYDSINIFKFLIMNDVELSVLNLKTVLLRNNEMIHIIESKLNSIFNQMSLLNSIGCWNVEMTEYALNNCGYDFLEKSDVDPKNDLILNYIMFGTAYSVNFIFFDTIFLPFLRKNDRYFTENIHNIIYSSLANLSCFFLMEFLKYPTININYENPYDDNMPFLTKAIENYNLKAVEILFKYPGLKYKTSLFDDFSPLHVACIYFSDLKIIDLICKDKNPSINCRISDDIQTPIFYAADCGNFYAIQKLIELCFEKEKRHYYDLCFVCLFGNHLFTLKVLLKYYFEHEKKNIDVFIKEFIDFCSNDNDYKKEYPDIIRQIYNEL